MEENSGENSGACLIKAEQQLIIQKAVLYEEGWTWMTFSQKVTQVSQTEFEEG